MEDIDMADVRLTQLFTNIANAIRNKKGSEGIIKAADFPAEIESIEVGGGEVVEVEEKDVNFYDYDGTLLFSYTLAEAQALTELPTPKGHEGLVFDGWNWDYEDVVAVDYPMNIGALYTTEDGSTRLHIECKEDGTSVSLLFTQSKSNDVLVKWGDGNEERFEETSVIASHIFSNKGKYVISIKGNAKFANINNKNLLLPAALLERIDLGEAMNINNYAFQLSYNLKTIAIPKSKKAFYNSEFIRCTSLKWINIPNGATQRQSIGFCSSLKGFSLGKIAAVGAYAFQGCFSVRKVHLPNTLTVIDPGAFTQNFFVEKVILPPLLEIINVMAFNECYSCFLFDFSRCKNIPTLSNVNAFTNVSSNVKYVVPDSLYEDWKATTNWSALADKIIKASEYVEQ